MSNKQKKKKHCCIKLLIRLLKFVGGPVVCVGGLKLSVLWDEGQNYMFSNLKYKASLLHIVVVFISQLRILGLLSTAQEVLSSALDPANVKLCGHAPHNGTVVYKTIS